MNMHDYPPEYDGPEVCEVCFRDVSHKETECDCPECPVCTEVGRLKCQLEHGLSPARPECAHDSIRDIPGLAALVSAVHDTEASIGRRMFKSTECGITLAASPEGVVVAGYAEGADVEIPGHELTYPFTPKSFWDACDQADKEGCAVWDEWNDEPE